MPDVKLPEVLRARMAMLGRDLLEAWPRHGSDWDLTYTAVALTELLNALLAGRRDDAADLLTEIEKAATR